MEIFTSFWISLDQSAAEFGIYGWLVIVIATGSIGLLIRQKLLQQVAQLKNEQHQLQSRLAELQQAQQQLHEAQLQGARLQEQNEHRRQTLHDLQRQLSQAQQNFQTSQEQLNILQNQHTELKTSLQAKQQHYEEQIRLLNDAREQLKKDFSLLANEILESKSKAFREVNQQSMQSLLNPVQTEMKSFREKVETIHSEDLRQRAELRTELLNLQKLNQEITDKAENLTNALQGQKKIQGNWGELILERVLDNSGLRQGKDYDREVSLKNTDGQTQRPDAIVYLPKDKHLIIDAKTSLSAYTRFVNADNEIDRNNALAEHTQAVSDRISELAKRDYYKLPGLNSPEVVIMFIPIESAYVEALRYDESLYQRAISNQVLVATPTTLLTSLNIVRQLWQFEDRNKHTAELAERAARFYNKLNTFLGSMQKVGNQLDNARESYDKALGQLYSGRGNLIKQAAEFKDLGVSVQKELPSELTDRADLEIEHFPTKGSD